MELGGLYAEFVSRRFIACRGCPPGEPQLLDTGIEIVNRDVRPPRPLGPDSEVEPVSVPLVSETGTDGNDDSGGLREVRSRAGLSGPVGRHRKDNNVPKAAGAEERSFVHVLI